MTDPIYRVKVVIDNDKFVEKEFTVDSNVCVEHGVTPRDVAVGYAVGMLDAKGCGTATVTLQNSEKFTAYQLDVETARFLTLTKKEAKEFIPDARGRIGFLYMEDTCTLVVTYLAENKTLH